MTSSNYWVIAGIVLLISEMLTGGFFLVFIALGAFAASLAAALDQNSAVQLATCAVVAIGGVLTLRKPIQQRLLVKAATVNTDVGREIQVDTDVAAHKKARIQYQGSGWEAVNVGSENIKAGDRVVIVGMDGILLLIRKVN